MHVKEDPIINEDDMLLRVVNLQRTFMTRNYDNHCVSLKTLS